MVNPSDRLYASTYLPTHSIAHELYPLDTQLALDSEFVSIQTVEHVAAPKERKTYGQKGVRVRNGCFTK